MTNIVSYNVNGRRGEGVTSRMERMKIKCPSKNDAYLSAATDLVENWTSLFSPRDDIRVDQRQKMTTRGQSVLTELLEMDEKSSNEVFFTKLVSLCCKSSWFNITVSKGMIKEAHRALKSVLKPGDVGRLAELPLPEKESQVQELIQIVMGITLFNKDCKKGGEGIDDLPELLTKAIQVVKVHLATVRKRVEGRCYKFTSRLAAVYHLRENMESDERILSPSEIDEMKSALALSWIQFIYLRDMESQLSRSESYVFTCVEQLKQTLLQLHETVRYRAAIPTVQVYPLFIQLSLVWREMQYESAVLGRYSYLVKLMNKSTEIVGPPEGEHALPKATSTKLLTPPFDDKVCFRGFCPMTLLQTEGVLIAGSHINDNIAFRNPYCAELWLRNVPQSMENLRKFVSSRPIFDIFYNVEKPACAEKHEIAKAEAEVQTDVHPIKSFIDRSYTWSDWDLRRRAIQLAKITDCLTKGQQTDLSNFRLNKSNQT